MSTTPTSCGGSSCSRATRRASCAPPLGVMIAAVLLGGLQLVRFAAPAEARPAPSSGGRWPRCAAALATAERRPPCLASPCSATSGSCSARAAAASSCTACRAAAGSRWASRSALPRRAARAALALSRALRRVGRPDRVLRDRARRSMPDLVELGLDLLQAGRAGVRAAGARSSSTGSDSLRPAPVACAGPSATVRRSRSCRPRTGPAADARAPRRSPTAGSRSKSAKEKGFSLGRFDPGLSAAVPGGDSCARDGTIVAFANLWATRRPARALDRPDALPRPRGARRDGLSVHPAHAVGQGAGLWPVRPRHGAPVRPAGPPARAACGPAPAPCCSPMASGSTISRACADTRRSSSRYGSRATWRRPAGLPRAAVLADVTCWSAAARSASCAIAGRPRTRCDHVEVGTAARAH